MGNPTRRSQASKPGIDVPLTRFFSIRTAPPSSAVARHSSAPFVHSGYVIFAMLSSTSTIPHSSSYTALRSESAIAHINPYGAGAHNVAAEEEPKFCLAEFLAQECPSPTSSTHSTGSSHKGRSVFSAHSGDYSLEAHPCFQSLDQLIV